MGMQSSTQHLGGKPLTTFYSQVLSKLALKPSGIQEKAQLAGGCFWGVQLTFQRIPGVLDTIVGYTQGNIENPSYKQVCSGTTNHAEAIEIAFDPNQITYQEILKVFFERHDASQSDGQGNDIGSQYRSGIYYFNEEQKQAALDVKDQVQKGEQYQGRKIVTEILPAQTFWKAEEFHQSYLVKNGQSGEKGCNEKIRCYG